MIRRLPLLALLLLPALGRGDERFGMLTVDQAAAQVGKAGVHFFDANDRRVFDAAHVPGARLVAARVAASDLPADKGATLVFYCKNPH